MIIGAQFYTVREYCKTLEDFAETLKKVADIGYTTVQISGVCPYEPQWLKEQLTKTGLKCVITHNPMDRMAQETQSVIEAHNTFDCDYIGLGSYKFAGETADEVKEFYDTIRPFAAEFRENGKYFMYHNHAAEFKKYGNVTVMETMAQTVPADLMGFTLDTYWVQVGGGDPAWWIKHLAGRVPCIHLKDCAYKQKMAVIGEGNINFESVFLEAEKAGTKYMLVEQDDCNGEDPLDCLKRSYDNLRAFGFR